MTPQGKFYNRQQDFDSAIFQHYVDSYGNEVYKSVNSIKFENVYKLKELQHVEDFRMNKQNQHRLADVVTKFFVGTNRNRPIAERWFEVFDGKEYYSYWVHRKYVNQI